MARPSIVSSPPVRSSGEEAGGDFRCAECGYGVVATTTLPICPMCRGTRWRAVQHRVLGRPSERPLPGRATGSAPAATPTQRRVLPLEPGARAR